MPPNGENPLARFAHAIADERGFSFGTPRVSDDGATVNLPVLRAHAPPRAYLLAAERADAVSAVDSGAIDRITVHNEGGARLFLPLGALFEGRDTPSRATVAGAILDPGATATVAVKCVHAGQAIRAGAPLCLSASIAPKTVAQALACQDQGAVWAAVAQVTRGPHGPPNGVSGSSGDLAQAVAGQPPEEAEMDGTQCGTIVLDGEGVVAVEVFDVPESWQASPRPRMPASPAAMEGLPLNPDGAAGIAQTFFRRLAALRYRRVGSQSWSSEDGSVAFTSLGDGVIHLIGFGQPLALPESGFGPRVSVGPASSPVEFPSGAISHVEAELGVAEGDVLAASRAGMEALESSEPSPLIARPRRRKVLTSGWDAGTFNVLEHYAGKEFEGDRSAAIRFLVREGLRGRGYMGPVPSSRPAGPEAWAELEPPSPTDESTLAAAEARIHDFERIVLTETYAGWLRQRARSELERIVAETRDEGLRSAAEAALARLPAEALVEEDLPEPAETEPLVAASPAPPPMDVRPLLRRAFADSAGGRYPEALTLFDEVLLAEPDNRTALLGRAVALRRSGKTEEALAALDHVLEKEPMNAAALLNRGRILQERGELESALEAFDALARVAPNDWDVWMVRGDVLARMGRDRDARAAYSEALRRNPDDEELLEKIHALEKVQPAPPPTPLQRAPLPREVQEGQSYLVKEHHPELSLRVVRALLIRAVPAMLITPRSAESVRRESGLAGVLTLELSHTPGEGRHDPTALGSLTKVVERFVRENHARGVILLEGVASLVRENGFRETALFIERVHETILQSHALFLVSVTPGGLDERELALLERSLTVLS